MSSQLPWGYLPKREAALCPFFIPELYQIPDGLILNVIRLCGPHQHGVLSRAGLCLPNMPSTVASNSACHRNSTGFNSQL